MYETGIYKYIYSTIHPNLLNCEYRQIYQGAKLPDLSAAFFLLLTGHLLGIIIVLVECFWYRRARVVPLYKQKAKKKRRGSNRLPFIN